MKSQVLSREVLDAVPNAHTIQSVGQLIPGVTLTSPDVAGSVQMQQTYFSVHGTGANGTSMTVDGMIINGLMLDGAVQTYMNDATAQEMVYRTGGGGGEQQTGGLQINVVPREGGNRFSGQLNLGFENWQSDNFGQELKDVGVTSVDKLGTYHDISATEGGPIKKDRLWWFASGRLSLEKKPVANTTDSSSIRDADRLGADESVGEQRGAVRVPRGGGAPAGTCAQGISDETVNSANGRLTLQLNSKNKLSAYLDRIHKDRASAHGRARRRAHHGRALEFADVHDELGEVDVHGLAAACCCRAAGRATSSATTTSIRRALEQPLYSPLWTTMAHRVYDNTFVYGDRPDRIRQLPGSLQLAGVGVLRHGLAQREPGLPGFVRHLQPVVRLERRHVCELHDQRHDGHRRGVDGPRRRDAAAL